MTQLQQLLLALVTPWGRLPQSIYGLLTLAVCVLHGAIVLFLASRIEDHPGYSGYNALSIALIALIWVQFCLMSRRFRDSSNAAFFLLPVIVATAAAYLYAIDHAGLAASPFQEDRDQAAFAEQIRTVFQTIGLALMLFALKSSGDSGPNAFGPEFVLETGTARHKMLPPVAKPVTTAPKTAPRSTPSPTVAEPRPLDRIGLPKERRQNLARQRPNDFGRR